MASDTQGSVIFELREGLGNQLFQYATGRAVSLRLGIPLLLDSRIYNYRSDARRPLLIDRFNIIAEISDHGSFPRWPDNGRLTGVGAALYRLRHPLIEERPLVHDTRVFDAKPGSYFKGYWQQEAYFSEFAATLREELTLRERPSPANQAMLEKILATKSVGVHVRRGDYRTDTKFALCSLGYYTRAAQLIAARSNEALTFFIFSDEPEWAVANLSLPGEAPVVNLNSDANSFEDLRLMSACQHNIIANSSFSWWGAWLNRNPDKIVVAPKTWYLTPHLSNDFINASSFLTLENLNP